MSDLETKLSAARTKLILDRPFLGALVLRLPLVAADPRWCKTTATDARTFYYNADYMDALTLDQTQFALAHEALHCALSHFARRQHRDRHRWDVACDLAINPLLIDEGLTPVQDALFLEEYKGMTAEEIYPCLDEADSLQPHDDHVYDQDSGDQGGKAGSGGDRGEGGGGQATQEDKDDKGGSGKPQPQQQDGQGGAPRPEPLSHEERERLSVQWRQRMAGAAQQALQAGKLGGALARLIDHLLQPQLPWRMLLARYMTATARDDYNYSRPSRREGDAIFPSLRSSEIDIVVALDTSGSVSDQEMGEFLAEIDAIKGQVRARVTLHACDAVLAEDGPWSYEPWEEFKLPREFKGGGGTSFLPVFDWLEREGRRPDLLVYFTDADGAFPAQEPGFPVIWLVKGKGKVPWGQRIQLN
ncbi:MAG: VWA-like domain-containing protein [Pseudomonadota bacterium]